MSDQKNPQRISSVKKDDSSTLWLTYHAFGAVRTIKACFFIGKFPFKEYHVGKSRWDSYNSTGCIAEQHGVMITHSTPVLMYAGKLANLYPISDIAKAAKIDEFLEMIRILRLRIQHMQKNAEQPGRDKNAVEEEDKDVKASLREITDKHLEHGGEWLCGNEMTVADIELQTVARAIPNKTLGITFFKKKGKEFAPLNVICMRVSKIAEVIKVDNIEKSLIKGGKIPGAHRIKSEPSKEFQSEDPAVAQTVEERKRSELLAKYQADKEADDAAAAAAAARRSARESQRRKQEEEERKKAEEAEEVTAETTIYPGQESESPK